MNKLRESAFLNDLYRDLRDRRLLIPIAALLVAIVAVPFLLGGGSSAPEAPLTSPTGSTEGAGAVEPAVLAEATGIRNYRERLAALKEKNPFDQKFALPSPQDVALQDSTSQSTATSSTSTSTTSSSVSSTTGISPPSSTGTSSSSSTGLPTATSPVDATPPVGAPDTNQGQPPKPEVRFFAAQVNVTIGPLGATERLKDVQPLDLLPNEKAPVVAFLGLTGSDKAVFSVSRDVTDSDGAGSCAPKKPSPCEFLTLKVGDERTLTYGPEGAVYRLKLLSTHVVAVPDPRKGSGNGG